MTSIRDATTDSLIRDAAALASRDPAFEADLDRYLMPATRRGRLRRIIGMCALKALLEDRPVPWQPDELLAELRRRKAEKAAINGAEQ